MRAGLKISKQEVPDYQIAMLIRALDDDGSDSVGIDELSDFVQRGTRTFNSGPDGGEADDGIVDSWDVPAEKVRHPAPCVGRTALTSALRPLPLHAPQPAKEQNREGFQGEAEEKEEDD